MSATSASKVLVPSAETPQKSLERSALNASVCLFLNASHADFSRLVIVVSFAPDLPDFAGLAWPKQRGAIVAKAIQQRTNCFFITCLYWTTRYSSRFFASLVSAFSTRSIHFTRPETKAAVVAARAVPMTRLGRIPVA